MEISRIFYLARELRVWYVRSICCVNLFIVAIFVFVKKKRIMNIFDVKNVIKAVVLPSIFVPWLVVLYSRNLGSVEF